MAEFKVFVCDRHREMCPKCMEELTRPGAVPVPHRRKRPGPAIDVNGYVSKLMTTLVQQPKITQTELRRAMGLSEHHLRTVLRVARRRGLLAGKRGYALPSEPQQ